MVNVMKKKILASLILIVLAGLVPAQLLYLDTPVYSGSGIGTLSHDYLQNGSYAANISVTASYTSGTFNGSSTQHVYARFAVVFEAKPANATDVEVQVAYGPTGYASITWPGSGKRSFSPYFRFCETDVDLPSWQSIHSQSIEPPDDEWTFSTTATRSFTRSVSGSGPWDIEKTVGIWAAHSLQNANSPGAAHGQFSVEVVRWRWRISGVWHNWVTP